MSTKGKKLPESKRAPNVKSAKKMGPPSKYFELVEPRLAEIQMWVRRGLKEKEIARAVGVDPNTFIGYKAAHPELAQVLKDGRDNADAQVEAAFHRRATGYQYLEITKELRLVDKGTKSGPPKYDLVVTKTVVKDVPPDVGACISWLANRQPSFWRTRPDEKRELSDVTFKILLPDDYNGTRPESVETPDEQSEEVKDDE